MGIARERNMKKGERKDMYSKETCTPNDKGAEGRALQKGKRGLRSDRATKVGLESDKNTKRRKTYLMGLWRTRASPRSWRRE